MGHGSTVLTWTPDRDEWSISLSGRFNRMERATVSAEYLVGPMADQEVVDKRNIFYSCREPNHCPTVS